MVVFLLEKCGPPVAPFRIGLFLLWIRSVGRTWNSVVLATILRAL